ncbi:STAS domain-containing protein [Kitasatospora sp. NPDC059571]|uniref:STAS domain-containing protein n=1 Tax=Kitasatospora sp. NPDC059571 TaxID=3346871 RepID=UPI0036AFE6F3
MAATAYSPGRISASPFPTAGATPAAPAYSPLFTDAAGRLSVRAVRAGSRPRIRISGEIHFDTVPALRTALETLTAGKPRAVDLDLGAVTFMDCSGLNALLELRRRGLATGFPVRLRAASWPVLHLLDLCDALPLLTRRPPPVGP